MSKKVFANDANVTLKGPLTLEQAGELHRFLVERLDALAQLRPTPDRVSIDLSGASDVDACGCQLLTLFVAHLARLGSVATVSAGAPDELRERMGRLGFEALFTEHPPEPADGAKPQLAKENA